MAKEVKKLGILPRTKTILIVYVWGNKINFKEIRGLKQQKLQKNAKGFNENKIASKKDWKMYKN